MYVLYLNIGNFYYQNNLDLRPKMCYKILWFDAQQLK